MTKEQMRIVIAEVCGWRNIINDEQAVLTNPLHRVTGVFGNKDYRLYVPNYPEDLNACHEMEKVFKDVQAFEYTGTLADLIMGRDKPNRDWLKSPLGAVRMSIFATSLQRCEAFIKTVCPERWVE